MKILAVSDLHGDKRKARELAERAYKENVDLVIICGDLTNFDISTEGLIGPFKEKKKEVIFVPGNHDSQTTADFLSEKYDIKNISGYGFVRDGIGFFGFSGWGPTTNDVFDYLLKGYEMVKDADKKVMITHWHPTGTRLDMGSNYGSPGVKKAIDKLKPDIHLCGHMHETFGMEELVGKTRVLNLGKEGKILEL